MARFNKVKWKVTGIFLLQTAHSIVRLSRVRYLLAGVVAFLVVFGVVGAFVVPPLAHHAAEQKLSALLDRPVTIGSLSLDPYTLKVSAERLHIGERGGQGSFVDIDRVVVRPSWLSLLRLAPVIGEVRITAPRVSIVRFDAQRFNFSDLVDKFSTPSSPQKKSLPFSVANIRIENGRIDFDDRLLHEKHLIDQCNIGIPYIATLPSKTNIFVQPMLHARIDGSPIAIDGKTKPFAASRESEITLKVHALDVPRLLTYSPKKLPFIASSGKISTNLTIDFMMAGAAPALKISGTVDLADMNVLDTNRAPLVKAKALHLAMASVEPLREMYHFDAIRADGPVVNLSRDKNGALNLAQLFASPPPRATQKKLAKPASADAHHALPDLSIGHLALNGGALNWHDAALRQPASLTVSNINVALDHFSTKTKTPAPYTFSAAMGHGGNVSATGTVTLAAKTADAKITAAALALAPWQPYIDSVNDVQIDAGAGKLGANAALHVDWTNAPVAVHLSQGALALDSVKVRPRGENRLALALAHVQLRLTQADLAPARNAQGQNQNAWHYQIGEADVTDSHLILTDDTTPRPVKLDVTGLQLKAQQLSDDLARAVPVQLQATVNRKGTLAARGSISPKPLKADLALEANRLDVAAVEPYFDHALNATVSSALLNLKGQLALAQRATWHADYRGDLALVHVRLLDKATSSPFAGWRALELSRMKADYGDAGARVGVQQITFSGFYGRLLLDAQGKLNLVNIVGKQEKDSESASPSAALPASQPAAAPPEPSTARADKGMDKDRMRVHVGQIVLKDGRANYTDDFVKPNYNASLVDIHGTIGAIGTHTVVPAPVNIEARLAPNGPITLTGVINPLAAKPALDLNAHARNIELTNLTPYSSKYAGYPILKGKLNVDLHYQLADDKLTADNHLFINQLTFGDHVDNDTATKLPVRLAVALLKNPKGEIDVDIPVSGSLSDPQFSLGGLIWRAVLHLVQKAVTAPFSLLANAFGTSGEELGYVEFAPGQASLTDGDARKLDTIAHALASKPDISIELTGRVDPAHDNPALGAQAIDRQIRQLMLKDRAGNGQSVEMSELKSDNKAYLKYLTQLYKRGNFKKPRNLVGFTKTLPAEQMKAALAAHTEVSDTMLRTLAQRRAQAVQKYLDGKVDASRVFVVTPKLDAQGITDKGATTRVDFGLK